MMKNVNIYEWKKSPFETDDKGVFSKPARREWFSPDRTKAVLEIWPSELYVAVKVRKEVDDYLEGEYVDHYTHLGIAYDFRYFSGVDWSYIEQGFCKLISVSIDTGDSFVNRFYFERKRA